MRPTLLLMISATIALAAPVSAQDGWRQEAEHAPWHKRYYFSAATFDDKLWVLGGSGGIPAFSSNDETCWHSDGTSAWDNVTPPPLWYQRLGLQAVAFDGRLWVVGGNGPTNYNDVWVSNDGIDWTLATASAPWAARWLHTLVAFNGRLWVMGGLANAPPLGNYPLNDVWSSADGVNWTMEVAAAAWPARISHTALVFNNRMWIFGGESYQGFMNDVWSSADGVNWRIETPSAPWSRRRGHQVVEYAGRIWLLGGHGPALHPPAFNDVWSSPDGANWTLENAAAPWMARVYFAAVVFKDRIWIMGGAFAEIVVNGTGRTVVDSGPRNDIWSYGLHLAPTALPNGTVTVPYQADLRAREGVGPYTWEVISGALPPGLSLEAPLADRLPISGTPTQAGQFTFQVKLTDGRGYMDEQTITLTIVPAPKLISGSAGCTSAPQPHLPLTTAIAAVLYALTRRRRTARPAQRKAQLRLP